MLYQLSKRQHRAAAQCSLWTSSFPGQDSLAKEGAYPPNIIHRNINVMFSLLI